MGITQTDLARRMGVSKQAVNQRVKAGRLTLLPDGTLDPAVAEREWYATAEPDAPPRPRLRADAPPPERAPTRAPAAPAAPGTFAAAKTAHSVFKAKLTQLEYELKAGTVVRVEDVKNRWFDLAKATRTRLMSIPQRLAAELAATSDVHTVRTRLENEIRAALEELSNDAV